jgi:N utilization substance protein A
MGYDASCCRNIFHAGKGDAGYMKVTLDQQTIQFMNLFQNLTGSTAVDCINEDDEIYFVIAEGKYGATVGKSGVKIKNAERVFKKRIRILEYAQNAEDFIRNIIPDVQEITRKESMIFIKVTAKDRPKVIGKAGKNIKIINRFLQRLFDVEELKVK